MAQINLPTQESMPTENSVNIRKARRLSTLKEMIRESCENSPINTKTAQQGKRQVDLIEFPKTGVSKLKETRKKSSSKSLNKLARLSSLFFKKKDTEEYSKELKESKYVITGNSDSDESDIESKIQLT